MRREGKLKSILRAAMNVKAQKRWLMPIKMAQPFFTQPPGYRAFLLIRFQMVQVVHLNGNAGAAVHQLQGFNETAQVKRSAKQRVPRHQPVGRCPQRMKVKRSANVKR